MRNIEKRLEFRIPISPTESFFSQVRFFNFSLRRLGGAYQRARLTVVVGDHCDIEAVRAQNAWSDAYNVKWERVPDHVFAEFGIWGTANWRLNLPVEDADVIILSDADTVLIRDIDPILTELPVSEAAVRGHMAHRPPPVEKETTGGIAGDSPEFWPWLFHKFELPWPSLLHQYSIHPEGTLPLIPAYYNLGFVAMNPAAHAIFGAEIINCERRLNALTRSHMRCQLAISIIAYSTGMNIGVVPAAYNTANDMMHLTLNYLAPDDIRVLHYLRTDEIDRRFILNDKEITEFLNRKLSNPTNILLQNLVNAYKNI